MAGNWWRLAQYVQVISPVAHHDAALAQMRCMVVRRGHRLSLDVREPRASASRTRTLSGGQTAVALKLGESHGVGTFLKARCEGIRYPQICTKNAELRKSCTSRPDKEKRDPHRRDRVLWGSSEMSRDALKGVLGGTEGFSSLSKACTTIEVK